MDDFEQVTLEDLTTELKKDLQRPNEKIYEEVKYYAKEFYEKFQNLSKLKDGGIVNNKDLKTLKFKNEIFNEQIYDSFFKFQNALLSYLGESIKVIFVYRSEDNQAHLGVVENDSTHLFQAKSGTIQYNLQEIKKVLIQENYQGENLLKRTFDEVELVRWARALETHEQKVWLPILWQSNGKWTGYKVNNRGTLAEAYASFYINEEYFFNIQRTMEDSVAFFIMNGAAQVDNKNGFLIGDVKKGKINFAIKKHEASPQKVLSIYKCLNKIMKDIDNPELFTSKLVEQFKTKEENKNAAKQAKKLMEKELEEAVDKMMKDNGKIYN